MICVSLGDIPFNKALEIVHSSGMAEIRADLCGYTDKQYLELLSGSAKILFTVRPGVFDAQERLRLFHLACENSAEFIDIEIESSEDFLNEIKELTSRTSTELIISYHNFEITPSADELRDLLHRCYEKGAEVAKVATMVNDPSDLSNLFSLYRHKGRKVVLGMGEEGIMSRIAAVPLGAEFTFASPEGELSTAPGQLNEKELKEVYNILKIR